MLADKASKAAVWRLEADLQPVAQLPAQDVPFQQILWASAEPDSLASVEASGLRIWSLQGSQAQVARASVNHISSVLCQVCPCESWPLSGHAYSP